MNVLGALHATRAALAKIESSRIDSNRLVAEAANVSVSELTLYEQKELTFEKLQWLKRSVQRRIGGEPLAYILRRCGFYKSDFFVTNGILIPRPESEAIVTEASRLLSGRNTARIADLGCGSGCIGLSILSDFPKGMLTCVDISPIAIQVSQENAHRLKLGENCEFILSDVAAVDRKSTYDLVVANPPYISPLDSRVETAVRQFEPHGALFAGEDGLEKIFAWSQWSFESLRPDGWWITEIGAGQNERVEDKLFEIGFCEIAIKKDLAGHWRTALARKP